MKKIYYVIICILMIGVVSACSIGSSKKIKSCKDCVFANYTDVKTIGKTKLTNSKESYTDINSKIFLGHKLNKDKTIEEGFVCGINKGKAFCLKGNSKESNYDYNKKIVDEVFDKGKCKEETYSDIKMYNCSDEIDLTITEKATVYISISKSDQCNILENNKMFCYKETKDK